MRELYIIEKQAINGGDLAVLSEKTFDLKISARWVKIAYVKIVQLTAGQMEVSMEVWESAAAQGSGGVDRTLYYQRKYRRRISQTPVQGGEYGEVVVLPVPYKDRDTVDEERTYMLHCRLVNEAGGTASDFDVSLNIAEIGEAV